MAEAPVVVTWVTSIGVLCGGGAPHQLRCCVVSGQWSQHLAGDARRCGRAPSTVCGPINIIVDRWATAVPTHARFCAAAWLRFHTTCCHSACRRSGAAGSKRRPCCCCCWRIAAVVRAIPRDTRASHGLRSFPFVWGCHARTSICTATGGAHTSAGVFFPNGSDASHAMRS